MAAPFQSLKGHFLLDGGNLRGSWFHRTVVLVCHHDAEGAFGLVLNRPAGQRVGEALPRQLPEPLRGQTLYLGGPVQQNALSYLHTDIFLPDAKVLPNLDLGHDLDELLDLGEGCSATRRLLVFAGYAGWSPGQLDDEIRRESWLVHPASAELVFAAQPETLWHDLLRRKGWQYRLLADGPEDLSVN
jgi:putative transcriptional regulator